MKSQVVLASNKFTSWDRYIIQTIEKAERMAKLYHTPCNVVALAGRALELSVLLEGLTPPAANVVETVYPPQEQKK